MATKASMASKILMATNIALRSRNPFLACFTYDLPIFSKGGSVEERLYKTTSTTN